MERSFARHIPSVVLSLGLLVLVGMFMALLISTGLLPVKYVLLVCLVLFVLVAWILYLLWEPYSLVRLIFGAVFTLLVVGIMGLGSSYLSQGVNTLNEITEVTVEVADVAVYVKKDDPAQSINEAGGYVFGILATRDRDNTDQAVRELEKELGASLNIREYDGLEGLVDSLITTGETGAIIINSAFVELLDDMEAYTDAKAQLREVYVQQVETVIEHVAQNDPAVDGQVDEQDQASQGDGNSFTVYISGIDSRDGLIAKSRSDVNILATVNTETKQILLVSTPRDYYVPLPISDGQRDKLTHAGIYGVDVSIGTMEMIYDMNIDYYFRVNFSGFEGIIDALGGVTVDSPVSFTRDDFTVYEGENYFNGSQALTFARERKYLADGDRQRGENQMILIKAVLSQAMSPAILTNYSQIMDQISGNFETSIPYDMIAELVRKQLDEGGEWNVVTYSVNGTDGNEIPYSLSTEAYVMIPDYDTVEQAKSLIQQVRDGAVLQQE